MALRLTTTDVNFTSAAWTPSGDFLLQCDSPVLGFVVEVQVQFDATAGWTVAETFMSGEEPVTRFVGFPSVRLAIRGNKAGNAVKIWDNS